MSSHPARRPRNRRKRLRQQKSDDREEPDEVDDGVFAGYQDGDETFWVWRDGTTEHWAYSDDYTEPSSSDTDVTLRFVYQSNAQVQSLQDFKDWIDGRVTTVPATVQKHVLSVLSW